MPFRTWSRRVVYVVPEPEKRAREAVLLASDIMKLGAEDGLMSDLLIPGHSCSDAVRLWPESARLLAHPPNPLHINPASGSKPAYKIIDRSVDKAYVIDGVSVVLNMPDRIVIETLSRDPSHSDVYNLSIVDSLPGHLIEETYRIQFSLDAASVNILLRTHPHNLTQRALGPYKIESGDMHATGIGGADEKNISMQDELLIRKENAAQRDGGNGGIYE